MKKLLRIAAFPFTLGLGLLFGNALADLQYTQGVGTTIFDFICQTTKHCSAQVLIDRTGTEKATLANPLRTDPTGTTTQPVTCISGCSSTGGTSSSFGAAFPSAGTAIGLSDGTNMVPLRGDATNGAWVNVKTSAPLAVTGTFWQATQPIVASALPLPTGAATQTTSAAILAQLAFGQQAMTASLPVTIASNQSAIPVTGTFWQASQPVTAIDGGLVTLGAEADSACATDNGTCTAVALYKRTNQRLTTINTTLGTPFQAGGTVTANLGTIGAAATAANQTNASQKTQIVDGSGNVIASTSNNLNVQCANCSGSGVSTVDEASFTAGSSIFAGTGGFFQTTATANALTNGQQGMVQMTATRALFTNLRNSSGAEMATSGVPLIVSGNGTAGSAASTVLTVQGIAGMTKLLVTPDSVALPANQSVNVSQINAVTPLMGNGATGTGSQRVTLANDSTLPNGWPSATNQVSSLTPVIPTTATASTGWLLGGQYNSTQATFTNGQQGAIQISSRGEVKSNIMDAGGNARGANVNASNQLSVSLDGGTGATVAAAQSGTWTVQPGNTQNTTPWLTSSTLRTTGGWTPVGKIAISNSSVTVKGSAGVLGLAVCDNNNAAWTYLQFFDATSPSVGTNVGFLAIPPNTASGYALPTEGLQFSNSIKVAATTAPGGSTAPATNTINCTFGYN